MAITLTKEDGTGLANANSYEDDAGASAYMEQTGHKAVWRAFSASQRNAALIVATQFMDQKYNARWLGILAEATEDTQALNWPRDDLFLPSGAVLPSDPIPVEIAQGCAEYALIDAGGGINPDPTYDASGRSVKITEVLVVGAVGKKTEFDGGTAPVTNRRYPAAEGVLRKWLTPSSRTLLRA